MILQVNGLQKSYRTGFLGKKTKVLHDMSFSIREGSVVGFIGANGAGKTTTIKSILGLIKPDSGEINYFNDQKISPDLFKEIGFLPERPNFYGFLTGQELLTYYGKLSNKYSASDLKTKVIETLKLVHLYESKDKLVKAYSKGMIQRVGIAQALLHDPRFIILDEPLSGLDPDGRYQLSQIILQAARNGKTIFFSSHLLDDTQRLCDHVVITKNGRVSYEGSLEELLKKSSVSYSVSYLQNGKLKNIDIQGEGPSLNMELAKIIESKGVVQEIRRLSGSLEEAYVGLIKEQERL